MPPRKEAPRRDPRGRFPRISLARVERLLTTVFGQQASREVPAYRAALEIGMSPASSNFRVYVAATTKYGLVTRVPGAPQMALTPMGQAVVNPGSDEEYAKALLGAALEPAEFKAMFDRYVGRRLPGEQALTQFVTSKFGLTGDAAKDCASLFVENMDFVGTLAAGPKGPYLTDDPSPKVRRRTSTGPARIAGPLLLPAETEAKKDAIFVSFGGPRAPFDELLALLDHFHVPYRTVDFDPTSGGMVSARALDTMRECRAAIFVLSPESGGTTNGPRPPNPNVLLELGAASMIFGNKILLLRERGLDLPLSLHTTPNIEFEAGQLSARSFELLRELASLGVIEIKVRGG